MIERRLPGRRIGAYGVGRRILDEGGRARQALPVDLPPQRAVVRGVALVERELHAGIAHFPNPLQDRKMLGGHVQRIEQQVDSRAHGVTSAKSYALGANGW